MHESEWDTAFFFPAFMPSSIRQGDVAGACMCDGYLTFSSANPQSLCFPLQMYGSQARAVWLLGISQFTPQKPSRDGSRIKTEID